MENIFPIIFFLWFVISLLDGFNKKKSPPSSQMPPQQHDENLDFEIPTLANDPGLSTKLPSEEVITLPTNNIAAIYKQRQALAQGKLPESLPMHQEVIQQVESASVFTPKDVLNVMILTEIFNKPKSLRRK